MGQVFKELRDVYPLKLLDAVLVPAECAEEGMLFVLQSGTDSHIGQGRKMMGERTELRHLDR